MSGTIQSINFTPGSGLATLWILTEHGDCLPAHCDAGPLARALLDSGARVGTAISYEISDYGTLSCFQVED